ncbi:MAG: T9SS type A sorting domain-containing protein [Candidatus Electryonea clarkiae]|nr:T9SS type A sorting domain-containing protein [Candidatus Electryonea clarkiae]MDP8288346.1 T9SS type A sorting domain-containing protein [Candidatus Electryonea clarkiae]
MLKIFKSFTVGFLLVFLLQCSTIAEVIYTQDFEDGLPEDWSVQDVDGQGVTWSIETNQTRDQLFPNYILMNAQAAGPGTADYLTMPALDMSEFIDVEMIFDHRLVVTEEEFGWVVVSVDSGVTWSNVHLYSSNTGGYPDTLNLSAWVDGEGDVRIRFRYDDPDENGGRYWGIDNIVVQGLSPTDEADILVTNVSIESDSIEVGLPFQVSVTIFNEGYTGAFDFNVAWFFDEEQMPDMGDRGDFTWDVDTLLSLTSVTLEGEVSYSRAGRKDMYIIVDSFNEVEEGVENNNVSGPYDAYAIVPPPTALDVMLDEETGNVELSWDPADPIGLESIIYDDGQNEQGFYFNDQAAPNSVMGERFTPSGECHIIEISAYNYHGDDAPLNDINFMIWGAGDDDTSPALPALFTSEQIDLVEDGWTVLDVEDQDLTFDGDFWIGVASPEPGGPIIGVDLSLPYDGRSYFSSVPYTVWYRISEEAGYVDGDLMIRAVVVVDRDLMTLGAEPGRTEGSALSPNNSIPESNVFSILNLEQTFQPHYSPSLGITLPFPHHMSERSGFSELDDLLGYNVYRNDIYLDFTTENSYTNELPDYGEYNYHITANFDEGLSAPTPTRTVLWNDPNADVLLIDLDPTPGSGEAVRSILNDLGYSWYYTTDENDIDEFTTFEHVFVFLGMVPNAARIVTDSPLENQLIEYLETGGNLYVEGGAFAIYLPPVNLVPYFSLTDIDRGENDLINIAGEEYGIAAGMRMAYGGENSWVGHIDPAGTATRVIHNPADDAGCAVIYAATEEPFYKTALFTFELGMLIDSPEPSTRMNLVENLMEWFGSEISSVFGTVTECDRGGEPMEGVYVYADGVLHDSTDNEGQYEIEAITSVEHNFRFVFPGFHERSVTFDVDPEGTMLDAIMTYPEIDVSTDDLTLQVVIGADGDSTGSAVLELSNTGCGPLTWNTLLHISETPFDHNQLAQGESAPKPEEIFTEWKHKRIQLKAPDPVIGQERQGNELDDPWNPWGDLSWEVAYGSAGAVITHDRLYTCTFYEPYYYYIYDLDGELLNRIDMPNRLHGIRDLEWDGEYMYGAIAESGEIYRWYPNQIGVNIQVTDQGHSLGRGLAYDSENQDFYVSNWHDDAGLAKLTPNGFGGYTFIELNLPHSRDDIYGLAWMPGDPDGMNLWMMAQTEDEDGWIYRYNPNTGHISRGFQLYPPGLPGAGMEISVGFDQGNITIATCVLNEQVDLWQGSDIASSAWLYVDPEARHGSVGPDDQTTAITIRADVSRRRVGRIFNLEYGDTGSGVIYLMGGIWDTVGPIAVNVVFSETAAPEDNSVMPEQYALYQNYPNPFNPDTRVRFDLVKAQYTKLTIYNILGQEIIRLIDEPLDAGFHSITFDAAGLTSGLYFYRIETSAFTELRKMVLIK